MSTQTRAALDESTRAAVRDLILVLADSKRLLGYRYAEWMLGAPELETGIACSSMAQDEWGHARLLYALLKDFDDDVDALEHGRPAAEYRSIAALDAPPDGWPGVVALMVLVDGALCVQFEALRGSAYEPLRQRMAKMLEEERFHAAHGSAWLRRLAGGGNASRAAMVAAIEEMIGPVLAWFGPDGGSGASLVEAGIADAAGGGLRRRFLERVAPLLDAAGLDAPGMADPDLAGFDPVRRRVGGGAPDEGTVAKIRGDRNRPFLMD